MVDKSFLDILLDATEVPSTESKGDFSDVIQTVQDSLDEAMGTGSEEPTSTDTSEENLD